MKPRILLAFRKDAKMWIQGFFDGGGNMTCSIVADPDAGAGCSGNLLDHSIADLCPVQCKDCNTVPVVGNTTEEAVDVANDDMMNSTTHIEDPNFGLYFKQTGSWAEVLAFIFGGVALSICWIECCRGRKFF